MVGRWGALGAAVAAIAFATSAGASQPPAAADSPGQLVRTYIAALDRHDGAAVCRLFAPRLRRYEKRSDPAAESVKRRETCARVVDAHFSGSYSRHVWKSASIRGELSYRWFRRTRILGVRMTLVHHYICTRGAPLPRHCHARPEARPDVVYLMRDSGRWRIVKPGAVYHASELPQPLGYGVEDLFPPGTPATVAGRARISGTSRPCRTTAAVRQRRHRLESIEGLPSSRRAPWLKIRSLSVTRISGPRVCFRLTLGAAPKPDSDYQIYLGQMRQQAAVLVFDVQIDGIGQPHPMLWGLTSFGEPKFARLLPKVYVHRRELEIIGSAPPYTGQRRFIVTAAAQSTQNEEPLIIRPLRLGDSAPLAGCLVYPSGAIFRKGLCGESPGG